MKWTQLNCNTRLLLLTGFILLGATVESQVQNPLLDGNWKDPESGIVVHFYQKGTEVLGKIVSLPERSPALGDHPQLDIHNPDKNLRERPLLGLPIITGLHYGMGKWTNGTIYSPKRGIYASCSLQVQENHMELKVTKSFFSLTKKWNRIP